MRQLFILLMFLLLSFSAIGQVEVTGVVVDQDGEILIGVNITEKGTNNGTITSIDGTFQLVTKVDSLELSYTGYISIVIPTNTKEINRIVLVEKFQMAHDFLPLEINDHFILSEGENTTTLNRSITEISIPGSTSEVLNTIPGLHMQSGGLNTNKLSIRGIGSTSKFATSGVKTFYNNIPLHNSIGESAIEDIGLHMADRIEVIRGTTGSEYEAGYGGAIIIKNKNIRSEEKTELSSKNTIGKWGYFTTQNQITIGRTDKTNSHNLAIYHSFMTDDGYRENNQFDRNNLTLNYTINKGGKLKLTGLLNRVDLKAFIPSSLNRDDYDNKPSKAAFTWSKAKGNEDYNRTLAGINLDYEFDYKRSMSHTLYGQFFESSELRPFNTIDESAITLGLKGKFQYNRPGYAEVFSFGYRIQQEEYEFDLFETDIDIKGSQFATGNEQRSIYELYATLESEINEKWFYKLGINTQYANIAADENKVLGKAFLLPEATFSFRPTNNKRIYISGGKGINYFSPQQALLPDGKYNSDLLPTSAWNINFGSKGIFANKLEYRSEIYFIWATDLITTERDETNQSINTNGGNATYSGLELALRYSLVGKLKSNKNLTINLHYNLMKNKYGDFIDNENDYSKNNIPGAPTQTLSTIIAGNHNGWFANIRYQHINDYYMRDDNSIKSDAYQLVHIMGGYKYKIGKWQITPRVDLVNLFDTKYASMTLVNASSFGGNAPRYYYSGRPRNVLVSLNINYDL
ncbi:MAG: iron complex outermembrane receptor protein [Saprospiraceae bacterium]|jgi:iron complex outermembrane receptor protein